jgi:poly(beta-D-mannuronate) lyase
MIKSKIDRGLLPLALVAGVVAAFAASTASATEKLCSTVPELTAAFTAARPGDVILMREGSWTDVDLRLEAEGSADRPITLRAATPGKVVLTGHSRLRFSGRHLVVDGLRFEKCSGPSNFDVVEFRTGSSHTVGCASDSRLTNCSFVDCNPPDSQTNTRWVSLYGTDNRVDHCYLAGKTNEGPSLVVWLQRDPVRHRIDHNHFGPRPPLGFNGGESIRIGDSRTSMVNAHCIVESNLFTGCDGEVEIISNKSCETIYRYNTFVDCAGTLTLRHGHRNLVEGNYFFGHHKPMTGGVRIINEEQRVINNYFDDLNGEGPYAALCMMNGIPNSAPNGYYQVKRAVVAFNTAVNCRENIVVGYIAATRREATLPPQDCTFANNLIVSATGPLVRTMTVPSGMTWLGNLLFGTDPGMCGQAGMTVSDPKLVQALDGQWRPARNSPAIGAAAGNFPLVTTDIDGQPRPAQKDIGCDQQSSSAVAHPPLTAADVGPGWMK